MKKIEEKTGVFSISLVHFAWGALFRGNTERLRRRPSVSTGLPVSCSLAINFGCRTRIILAKGSSSILANRRILYQNYSVVDSGIHNRDFCTITNLVKPKLQVQFDICCRTGLIQRSLTEAKRNRTFASFQRTNSRQSAVSLIHFTNDLVFSTMRDKESCDLYKLPASTSPARTF